MENQELKEKWSDLVDDMEWTENEIRRLNNEKRNNFLQSVSLYAQAKQLHDLSFGEDRALEIPSNWFDNEEFEESYISHYHLNDKWEVEYVTITSKTDKTKTVKCIIGDLSGRKFDWWLYAGTMHDIIARDFPVLF